MDDRQVMNAIFYLLRTGSQWKALPRCLGDSSTVHDRFQLWAEQGVFLRMWEMGLKQYAEEVGLDWERKQIIHDIPNYETKALESRANTFVDESISTVVDPLGEKIRELLSNDSYILCMHCDTRDSGFRIGS